MISVENIIKQFGGLRAVDDCSFAVPPGSITGLIGPNGAGKSTLFAIAAGFLQPDAGRVSLDGEDITNLAPHKRFHKGLVRTFQIPHEFSHMTVLENLMLVPPAQDGEDVRNVLLRPGRVRKRERDVRERAQDVLEFLQLTKLRDELAGNLSGGQKKLLELGRTMMTEARMVLLDEPGAGVNRTLLGHLAEDIERLNRERGYTFCIIEHDMDLITRLCEPVIVMAEGKVLTQGTMDEVRANQQVREAYLGSTAEASE
jgi:branched-chain amino acid transport system ATP-binding protein